MLSYEQTMEELTLTKSKKLINYQALLVVIIAVFLVLLSFMLLAGGRQMLGIDVTTLGWIVRIAILLLAGAAIFATYQSGNRTQYTFAKDTLTIRSAGLTGGSTTTVVPITGRSVISLSISQTFFEKMFDAGTVEIVTDGNSGQSTYRIQSVDEPSEVLAMLSQQIQR